MCQFFFKLISIQLYIIDLFLVTQPIEFNSDQYILFAISFAEKKCNKFANVLQLEKLVRLMYDHDSGFQFRTV